MKVCEFVVFGAAKPQGSTKTITRPIFEPGTKMPKRGPNGQILMRSVITHSNRDSLMQWRSDIRSAVQQHAPELQSALLKGPVAIRIVFYVTKPPSISKRRVFPIVAPDLDKMLRAVGDALEKVVLVNDASIVHWDAWKVYTEGRSRATVEIWEPDCLVMPRDENPFQQVGLF